MPVSNFASALGEAVGKLVEDHLEYLLRPICETRGFVFDRGGGKPLKMINSSGNTYQLDGVIRDRKKKPLILLESKY
ncbi:MAG: hypothetical protein AB1744_15770, partial [Candidatus Zixiibacteriota bacterium]